MNFDKIEMQGFKSFADKTKIKFDSPVTAIVGPNGCGKSNVADAVRWVLGEQSAKLLRGKSMQDVIFNGTENRKSTSYCEVSLFFDNRQRNFQIDFDELVLTRKLDRSGDSEYLINSTPCRLKDIVDLLRDTGVGREGYSIIGQGRIDDILSSKPEDRRNIFEEAAGIAKSKSKKNESERKLFRTRENLSRHEDIMGELNNQLEPLRKQSEDTKKYLELKESLKVAEVNTYIYNFENNEREKDQINKRLLDIESRLESEKTALNDIVAEFNQKIESISSADAVISTLRDELTTHLVKEEKDAGEYRLKAQNIEQLRGEESRLTAELEDAKNSLEQRQNIINSCQTNAEQLNLSINQKTQALIKSEEELAALKAELLQKEGLIESDNKKQIDSINKLGEIKAKMSRLQKELELLRDRRIVLEQRAEEIGFAYSEVEERRVQLELQKKELDINIVEKGIEQKQLQDKYGEKNSAIERAVKQHAALTQRVAALETRQKMLEEMKNQYDGYAYPVRKLMVDSRADVSMSKKNLGVFAELISVDQKYEQAIDVSLGSALMFVVTANSEDAKFFVQFLKEKRYGRVTFLPLDTMRPRMLEKEHMAILSEKGCLGLASDLIAYDKKFENVIKNLLGKTVIVDNIDTAIALARKYNQSFKIVTLEGDVLASSGSITGGSKKSDSNTDLIARDRTIAEVKKLLEDATKQADTLESASSVARQDIEKLVDKINILNLEIKSHELDQVAICERLEKANAQLADLSREKTANEEQCANITGKMTEISFDINSIDVLEAEINKEKEGIGKTRESHKAEADKQKLMREELEEAVSIERVNLGNTKKDLEAIEALKARVEMECQDKAKLILRAEGELLKVCEAIKIVQEKLAKRVVDEAARAEIDGLKAKLKDLEDIKNASGAALKELEEKRNIKSDEVSELATQKIKEESLLERIDIDSKMLEERVSEEYELDYAKALEFRDENYDHLKSLSDINKLKRKITNLGNVNLLAIEEYAEVGIRYEGMALQRDDMLRAEADLLKIINDLTKEMHSRFLGEFEKINANFMTIFKQLFGGGKAHLAIENNESKDILEAGIEIYAQPPGKKLQHISLLSGGEKALTAIAILFAILKLKPMPFCVLDEIEAALDDSNANLFAEYLKKFSSRTQFIVITHRKPTMELADTLYGVTMEEKGVSKLVSVQLAQALQQAEEGVLTNNE